MLGYQIVLLEHGHLASDHPTISYIIFLLFYMYECLHVCMYIAYIYGVLELELQMLVSGHVGARNLGPLEEQQGLLTAESSLQTLTPPPLHPHI